MKAAFESAVWHGDKPLTCGYTAQMGDVVGECVCGCGQPLAPDGPSPHFRSDHCATNWNRAQIGLPALPPPPPFPGAPPFGGPWADVMPGPAGAKLPARAA